MVIFFTNFLALMIKAEVANPDSRGSTTYSVVLITVNVLFFLSIWWNAFATIKAVFSTTNVQVRRPVVVHTLVKKNIDMLPNVCSVV